MRFVAAVPVIAAALALAPAAAALIPFQPGDKALIYPTHIVCTTDVSRSSGPTLHCFKGSKSTAPISGSYQISISRSSASVERLGSNGKTTQVFHRAQPKSPNVTLVPRSGRSATVFALQYGDIPAVVAGTNVFCIVTGKPRGLVCNVAANSKMDATITGSYGIVITEKSITVTQASDPQGHSKAVFSKNL